MRLITQPRRHPHPQVVNRARVRFRETVAIERLVAEDGRRLNAQIQELLVLRGRLVEGCSPLMLTAWR